MKYDIKTQKIAIHCPTRELAEKVLDRFIEEGVKVCKKADLRKWIYSQEETCFDYYVGNYFGFASKSYYQEKGVKIIPAQQYLDSFKPTDMQDPRILNLEELEASEDWEVDENGDWMHKKTRFHIYKEMINKSAQSFYPTPEMIAPQKPQQQEPKEGDLVEVWNGEEKPKTPIKKIFLTKLKNSSCICVEEIYNTAYLNGEYFAPVIWNNFAPIPKPTVEEIAEKVGLSVEELKRVVNG